MPTKPNRAGNQQNYVPAGNGDASGEYGDNATGSNIHVQFTNFKKPDDNPNDTPEVKEKKDKEFWESQTKKIEEVGKKLKELKRKQETKSDYYLIDLQKKTVKPSTEEDYYKHVYDNFTSPKKVLNVDIPVFPSEEDKNAFFNAYLEDALLCADLPNFNTEEDFLSLLPTSEKGFARLKTQFPGLEDHIINKMVFKAMYKEDLEKISEEVSKKINEKRIQLGKEYIENHFKKIVGNHTIDDDIKNTNKRYYGEKYGVERKDNEGRRINCQRCAYAFELRCRGYDVQAQVNDDKYGQVDKYPFQMIYKEKYNINKTTYKSAQKEIERIVSEAGNGSRFAICVYWKSSGGHVFNVINENGKIRYVDAQNGSLDVSNYMSRSIAQNIELYRLDNAEFSGSVSKTAENFDS